MSDTILIIDDEHSLRSIVKDVLEDEGFAVVEASDGRKGLRMFREHMPEAVLLDLNMPGMNGIDTMRELLKLDSSIPVIILTAFGDVPTAVGMIKEGAYDFTVKPPEFDRLVITLRKAVEARKMSLAVRNLDSQLELSLEDRLGRSSSIRGVINQIRQVARTDISVIIQGETGTGKSVAAGVIHSLSPRVERPYVHVDIGLIPEQLVESELFGYKKGAFTGADRERKGYFETADTGTILLDELENMSAHVQMKLLSVLERKIIYRLGSTNPVNINTRVLAATNADILKHVADRTFREDLFYRLGEFVITMPPLRERAEDILFFAEKFIRESSSDMNRQIRPLAPEATELLLRHTWPGNLRELKNVIRKAVLLTEGEVIGKEHIDITPENDRKSGYVAPRSSLKAALRDLEFRLISETLRQTGYNKSKAAELLDTSYTNLLAKIKEYGIVFQERPGSGGGGNNLT